MITYTFSNGRAIDRRSAVSGQMFALTSDKRIGETMRSMAKVAVTASVLLAGMAIATPAQAATASAQDTGRSGCFNYSYSEGISTTTVYFHNICNETSTINIWWKEGGVEYMKAATVPADGKGHLKHGGSIKEIDG
ncbi:MAG: hypothetical protein HOW71_36020 [Nonomuraea sp.]|nr:hypothetical protein [Nonomuraea sp.]